VDIFLSLKAPRQLIVEPPIWNLATDCADKTKVLSRHPPYSLTAQDFLSLRGQNWLTDTVIVVVISLYLNYHCLVNYHVGDRLILDPLCATKHPPSEYTDNDGNFRGHILQYVHHSKWKGDLLNVHWIHLKLIIRPDLN
jgi:hypothetical protein